MRRLVGIIAKGRYVSLDRMPEEVQEQALAAELGVKVEHRGRGLQIVGDIDPHMSIVDGSYVGSRRDQREHNRRNDVVVIGSENPKEPVRPKPDRREIKDALVDSWRRWDAKGFNAIRELREQNEKGA